MTGLRLATRLLGLVLVGSLASSAWADGNVPRQSVPDELIVGLRAGVGASGRFSLLNQFSATYLEDVGSSLRIMRIRVPAGRLASVMRTLQRLPEVKFVEPNYEHERALLPNDPQYSTQWHLPRIKAPQAWDSSQGAASTVIAILDTGIDATHPDFSGKLVAGYDVVAKSTSTVDTVGHGTEVAGAAAAKTMNAVGIAGVAGAASLMPVKVTSTTGTASSSSIANGIIWAADRGAKVINVSFNNIAGNATIGSAAQYAFNKGALIVAAAGNCGCTDPTPENPFVLSVSATDETDAVASFSSIGPYVDLAAPGNNILTTQRLGSYGLASGTSLSSPLVAGVAALMFTVKPSLTPALVTQLLQATAVDLGPAGHDDGYGYGRLDAAAAVAAAAAYVPGDTVPPTVTLVAPLAGATVSGTAVVEGTSQDVVGVSKVDLYVDGVFFASDTTAPYAFAWDTTRVANGNHTLELVASDAANNVGRSGVITVNVSNGSADTAAPTVSFTAPAAGATVSGTVAVTANASDNVGVARVDMAVDNVTVGTDATAPYAFSWNSASVADGSHVIKLTAFDAAGNSSSAQLTVTVKNAVNRAPVAVNDVATATVRTKNSYTAKLVNVLANDSDPDNNLSASTVKIVTAPDKGGTVTVATTGVVSYTPKIGFKGIETFTYNVKDTAGLSSNTAAVTVTVQ